MKLNQDEIKTILPHREPMLLVTSVEDLSPGEDIRAVFFADPKMDIFLGHFPEEPILPGDTLEIHANIISEKREKAIVTCAAEVYVHQERVANGDITIAMR